MEFIKAYIGTSGEKYANHLKMINFSTHSSISLVVSSLKKNNIEKKEVNKNDLSKMWF